MKYFTVDQFVRFCSLDDRIANEAHIECEHALIAYRKRLQRLRPEMPRGIRRLVDELRLHDAVLLHEASFGKRCLLSLRLDSPGGEVVLLDYETTESPTLTALDLPPEARSVSPLYVFDEIEKLRSSNGKPVFQHSIFFGHGYLFVVRFYDLRISIGAEVLPIRSDSTLPAMARTA